VAKRFDRAPSLDSLEKSGFSVHFFEMICYCAFRQQSNFNIRQYKIKDCSLFWSRVHIYTGLPGENLDTYRDAHIQIMAYYREQDFTRKLGSLFEKIIEDDERVIASKLEKFIDMERLPGHCELCEVSDPESRNDL
jgi:hypothetical protein